MTFTSDITVTPIQGMGGDYMVVAAAKVSTSGKDAQQWADESKCAECNGLINYLMKHRHGTPFEHGALTLFINAPIFVWREWHRHRIGFSYNEESARYKVLEPVFYVPEATRPMFKVDNWAPGRPKFLRIDEMSDPDDARYKFEVFVGNLKRSYAMAYDIYIGGIEAGFDPGLARDCLPVGIFSSCWVTCNPRSLMNFLSLRVHDEDAAFVSYPLYEIQVAAEMAEEILKKNWPMTYEAFIKNKRIAP